MSRSRRSEFFTHGGDKHRKAGETLPGTLGRARSERRALARAERRVLILRLRGWRKVARSFDKVLLNQVVSRLLRRF